MDKSMRRICCFSIRNSSAWEEKEQQKRGEKSASIVECNEDCFQHWSRSRKKTDLSNVNIIDRCSSRIAAFEQKKKEKEQLTSSPNHMQIPNPWWMKNKEYNIFIWSKSESNSISSPDYSREYHDDARRMRRSFVWATSDIDSSSHVSWLIDWWIAVQHEDVSRVPKLSSLSVRRRLIWNIASEMMSFLSSRMAHG